MYCVKCGKQISDDAAFCSGCGTAVGGATQPTAVDAQPSEQDLAMANEMRRRINTRKVLVRIKGIIIPIVLTLGAVLFAWLFGIGIYLPDEDMKIASFIVLGVVIVGIVIYSIIVSMKVSKLSIKEFGDLCPNCASRGANVVTTGFTHPFGIISSNSQPINAYKCPNCGCQWPIE